MLANSISLSMDGLPLEGAFSPTLEPAEYAMDETWMPQSSLHGQGALHVGFGAPPPAFDHQSMIGAGAQRGQPGSLAGVSGRPQPGAAQMQPSALLPTTSAAITGAMQARLAPTQKRGRTVAGPGGGLPSYDQHATHTHAPAPPPLQGGGGGGGGSLGRKESPRIAGVVHSGRGAGSQVRWQHNPHTKHYAVYSEGMTRVEDATMLCDVEKGFKVSATEGFICQKKNHFQVSIRASAADALAAVETGDGATAKIEGLYVELYGIKCENPEHRIKLDQSSTDRQKRPFKPVRLSAGTVGQPLRLTTTIGRLHFNETTANNMRKRGKPNPDQRFFALVVSFNAMAGGKMYPISSQMSGKLIVRASNPGHFETDTSQLWAKGQTVNSVCHVGSVGVNNDAPNEALCVDGNMRITGTLLQPSDRRVKENIAPTNTAQQLNNIQRLPLYTYNLTNEWQETIGLSNQVPLQCGVLAQEVQTILPDAIRHAGDVQLNNGGIIPDLLTVDKDRINMEALGAIKELAKRTEDLQGHVAGQEDTLAALDMELDELAGNSWYDSAQKKVKQAAAFPYMLTKRVSELAILSFCNAISAADGDAMQS